MCNRQVMSMGGCDGYRRRRPAVEAMLRNAVSGQLLTLSGSGP